MALACIIPPFIPLPIVKLPLEPLPICTSPVNVVAPVTPRVPATVVLPVSDETVNLLVATSKSPSTPTASVAFIVVAFIVVAPRAPVTPRVPATVVLPVTPRVPATIVSPVSDETVNLSVATAIPPFAFNDSLKVFIPLIS